MKLPVSAKMDMFLERDWKYQTEKRQEQILKVDPIMWLYEIVFRSSKVLPWLNSVLGLVTAEAPKERFNRHIQWWPPCLPSIREPPWSIWPKPGSLAMCCRYRKSSWGWVWDGAINSGRSLQQPHNKASHGASWSQLFSPDVLALLPPPIENGMSVLLVPSPRWASAGIYTDASWKPHS